MTVELVLGVILPVTLIVVMTTLGVGLRPADVAGVLWRPKVWLGVTALQFVLLPLVGLACVAILGADPLLTLVLLAVATAPGGTFSNVFTFIAGGNLALSVVLTALSTFLAALLSPLLFVWSIHLVGLDSTVSALDPLRVARDLAILVFLPLLAGTLLARLLPATADRIRSVAEPLSAVSVALLVFACIWVSGPALPEAMPPMLLGAGLFTAGALALGWLVGRVLPPQDRSAIGIEFAVRNTPVAMFIMSGPAPDVRTVAYFLSYFIVAATGMLFASLLLRRAGRTVSA